MTPRRLLGALAAALLSLLPAGLFAAEADLILSGGRVFLGPGRFARAVAVRGNRVAAVGSERRVLRLRGPRTRVVRLKGRAVTPGFHDAHLHLMKGALFLSQADLNGAASIEEVQKKLKAHLAKRPGRGWVLGRGWDHTAFPDGRYPDRSDLDAVVSTRPVALTDADGHKLWLNTEALRRAGITLLRDPARTPLRRTRSEPGDPNVLRDADGRATGILLEDAIKPVQKRIPEPSRAEKLAALRRAFALARESGVTSVQSLPGLVDAEPAELFELWDELDRAGEPTVRLFLYGRIEEAGDYGELRRRILGRPRTRVGFVGAKIFVDGVLGARTAALLEPYFDDPETRGKPKHSADGLEGLVRRAHAEGLQAALHAIGDRAVRMALDACEASQDRARRRRQVLPEVPCRLEHVEVVDPEDIPRFSELGVAASMQPSHMTYDNEVQNYNPNRLGSRVRTSFAWRSLDEEGALVAYGTDWPVMPLHPRVALFAAATRRHFNGEPEGGWIPKQRVSLQTAVEAYTRAPARLVGRDEELGRIAPGHLADLVVWDRDLFSTRGMDLLKLETDLTVFDGKVVYERKPAR